MTTKTDLAYENYGSLKSIAQHYHFLNEWYEATKGNGAFPGMQEMRDTGEHIERRAGRWLGSAIIGSLQDNDPVITSVWTESHKIANQLGAATALEIPAIMFCDLGTEERELEIRKSVELLGGADWRYDGTTRINGSNSFSVLYVNQRID